MQNEFFSEKVLSKSAINTNYRGRKWRQIAEQERKLRKLYEKQRNLIKKQQEEQYSLAEKLKLNIEELKTELEKYRTDCSLEKINELKETIANKEVAITKLKSMHKKAMQKASIIIEQYFTEKLESTSSSTLEKDISILEKINA